MNRYRPRFDTLTAHFGQWVPQVGKRWPVWQVDSRLLYGQLHKVKVGYKLKSMYTVAVCGTRRKGRQIHLWCRDGILHPPPAYFRIATMQIHEGFLTTFS